MKMLRYLFIILSLLSVCIVKSVAADDDFRGFKTTLPMTIDGIADENVWDSASWYPMSWVWLPYNDVVDSLDFTGRFKIAWDTARLYILVEVVDNSLFDGHPSPLDNYWNDDCVEIFLDEDKSGGNHLNSYNAFAYHVSTLFDVVDNTDVANITALFNDHISAAWTKIDSLYTWELEIKVYPSTFTRSNPGLPVTLTPNKLMGFSLAYCDTDGSMTRENFIGSKYLPEAQSNDSYINASLFGSLTLYDPAYIPPTAVINKDIQPINFYPNPAKEVIYYSVNKGAAVPESVRFINLTGQVVYEIKLADNSGMGYFTVGNIERGTYIFEVISTNQTDFRQIVLY
jgi:hypothetical protein